MIKRARLYLVLIGKDLLIRHDNMYISSIHVWSEEPCLSTLKISVCLNVICYIIRCHSEKASQQKDTLMVLQLFYGFQTGKGGLGEYS